MELLTDRIYKLFLLLAMTILAGCVSTGTDDPARNPADAERENLSLARDFLQAGYPQQAIVRLEKVLEKNNRSSAAYGVLGVVYQRQAEYELADKQFRSALRIDPKASDIRNNYGVLLYEMGRYDEAYEQFLKVTDDIYYEQRNRAFENLGFVALQRNDLKDAEERFKRAIRLDGNLPSAALELAVLLYDQQNFVVANSYYQRFVSLSPQQSSRSLWLGIRLSNIFQDDTRARRYGDELVRLYPGSKEYQQYQALLTDD